MVHIDLQGARIDTWRQAWFRNDGTITEKPVFAYQHQRVDLRRVLCLVGEEGRPAAHRVEVDRLGTPPEKVSINQSRPSVHAPARNIAA